MQHTRPRPLGRAVTGFFKEFALSTELEVFSCIEFARGELDHDLADGIAKLALKYHLDSALLVLKQRNDHNGTWMHNIFPSGSCPIGQPDHIAIGMQKVTLDQFFSAESLLNQMAIIHENCRERNTSISRDTAEQKTDDGLQAG